MIDFAEVERLAGRLEFMATVGDMGRKPDPTCDKRLAAKMLRKMAKALAA